MRAGNGAIVKKSRNLLLTAGAAVFGLVTVIGCAAGSGTSTPSGNLSSASSATITPGAPTSHPAVPPTAAPPRTSAPAAQASAPSRTAPAAPPTGHAAPPPPPPTTAAAAPHCYPLSNEGTCYEPGEFCRDADHGASGVAGDGKAITCEDKDGWRWEPT